MRGEGCYSPCHLSPPPLMLPTPLIPVLSSPMRYSCDCLLSVAPHHLTFVSHFFLFFSHETSSCQFLPGPVFFLHASSFLLLRLCLLVDSFFTLYLSSLLSNQSSSTLLASSFHFLFSPLPLKSSHLLLYFPEEYSESCLLLLVMSSAVQSGVFVSRHCR